MWNRTETFLLDLAFLSVFAPLWMLESAVSKEKMMGGVHFCLFFFFWVLFFFSSSSYNDVFYTAVCVRARMWSAALGCCARREGRREGGYVGGRGQRT